MSQRLGPGGGPGAQSVVGGTRWPLPRPVTFQGPLPGARLVQKGVCLPSWSLLFPDWPHPASPASIPRPGRRLCRGERDTRPPALPAGWCQVFTWGELSAGAWFPELAAGTGHAPPRAPPRWGLAVGPHPAGGWQWALRPQVPLLSRVVLSVPSRVRTCAWRGFRKQLGKRSVRTRS